MTDDAPPRPLWHEVLLVCAPVLVTEVMGALRDRWHDRREARLVALGFELPSDEQRAQNIREITDHFCQGGFLP